MLSLLAQILNHRLFHEVHELSRRLHLKIWPIVLQKLFDFQWIPRHSVQHQGGFHCLYSDLDLALILPLYTNPDRAERAIRGYGKLKNIFLFLGELEVYYEPEWIEKKRLETQYSSLLRLIRNYRKIKWLENDFQTYSDPYHKQKALRALRKIHKEFPNWDQSLLALISKDSQTFLASFPEVSEVVPFFDRNLSETLSHESAQFLKALAPNFQLATPLTAELQKLRRIVLTWEFLCYQAYLRQKEKKLFTTNDWLSQIAFELNRKLILSPEDQKIRIYTWTESLKLDPLELSLPFSIQLDLTERMRDHLNETYSRQNLSQSLKEEEILHRALQIHSSNPFASQWLNTNLPTLSCKLVENFQNRKFFSPSQRNNLQAPQNLTLSFWGPLAPRFGLHLLLDLLRQLENLTQNHWTLELCGPDMPPYSEKALFELLDYASSNQFQIRSAKAPSGLLLLPYRWNLDEEVLWIEKAQNIPLPAVIGFDTDLAQRVLKSFETQQDQISSQFQSETSNQSPNSSDWRLRMHAWEWDENKVQQLPASLHDLNEYLNSTLQA